MLQFFSKAFEEATKALRADEVPVGAVIVKDDTIISSCYNQMKSLKNAIVHAEILCIQEACVALESQFLTDCDLYVTLEPCIMCAGAIAQARIRSVYFGAYDPKGGAVCHGPHIFKHSLWKPEIVGGIWEEKCALLLTQFFQNKR